MKAGFWLLGLFIVLIVSYEAMYYNLSVSCLEGKRCVISSASVLKAVEPDLAGWKNANVKNPVEALMLGYRCASTEVWSFKDLALPYYSFLFLYFGIAITLILLIISLSDKIANNETP